MKTAKKALALFLTLVMCLSLVPAAAFADKPVYKVVAVGDSTCIGLGLNDYGVYKICDYITSENEVIPYSSAFNHGFLEYGSAKAYPALLADYLAEKLKDRKVEFINLGISGIRCDEILEIIEPGGRLDTTGQSNMDEYRNVLAPAYGLDEEGLTGLFRREIKSADLITLDSVMNNFTGYMTSRIDAILSGDAERIEEYGDSLSDLAELVQPGARQLMYSMSEVLMNILRDKMTDSELSDLIYAVTYCYYDFCLHFSQLVRKIRELNPTARMLVGGAYVPFNGMSLYANGTELPMDKITLALKGILDTYITAIAPERNEYSFIDVPDDVQTFREYMASFDSVWELPEVFLMRIVDSLFGDNHMELAVPLCTRARAEAAKLDLTIRPIYPVDIIEAFDDVRENGEDADIINVLLTDQFGRFIDLILMGAKINSIDLETLLDSLSIYSFGTILSLMDVPDEELTEADTTKLFIAACTGIRDGIAAHFSEQGCYQKYEAAVKAYESGMTAEGSSANVIRDMGHSAADAAWVILKPSVMEKLASIDFADFFASIAENVRQFFISLLPAC